MRLAWIFGVISTRDYDYRNRQKRIGACAIGANEGALERLERSLTRDRVAVIIILIAITILLYAFQYAPASTP